jgi:hypothetical protein
MKQRGENAQKKKNKYSELKNVKAISNLAKLKGKI